MRKSKKPEKDSSTRTDTAGAKGSHPCGGGMENVRVSARGARSPRQHRQEGSAWSTGPWPLRPHMNGKTGAYPNGIA